ncbi:spore coat U domain-containing protein [Novosphingobium sp.]|uniref:Csu type fimbrial protein n=1 Tax=Novosphingobium sp. TaxID=1874826 RepID=UPI0033400397
MSATAMNFGQVGTAGVATMQTNSTSAITVTCTNGGSYSVSLDGGQNGVAAQRNIKSGLNTLNYDLYKDAARGTVWTNVTAPVVGTGIATAQIIPIYGRIAAGQPYSSGNGTDFTDTVVVTLTY